MEAATGYTIWTIYLSWIGTWDHTNTNPLSTWLTYSGQTVTWYIYQTITDKWNVCEYTADNIIDKSQPTITSLSAEPVPECTTWMANIEATDDGCGKDLLKYKWNWDTDFWFDTQYLLWSGKVWEKIVNVQVKDMVWNITWSNVTFKWTNTQITANDFTWSTNVWNSEKTTNWRINSNAMDWLCGSGAENVIWSGFISIWGKWECIRNWDNITYTPKPNQTWEDTLSILRF